VRNTKWYPIDCGMMHSISSVEKSDIGKSFETAVFHALRVKYGEVFYWREQGEVDFIVLEGNAPRPVQASWDGLRPRHVKAIEEFQTRYPNALDPVVINQDNFSAM
jgi:predicted AAA+ superfamily ATPase